MTKNPPLLAAVRARLRAGASQREVAAALGVSLGSVAGLLRRHGLGEPPTRQRRPPEDTMRLLEAIRAGLRRGLDVAAASRAVGVTDDVGRGLIRRHGRGEAPQAAPPALPPARLVLEPMELPGSPRDGGCNWPTSDGPPWRFCNAPRQPGHSYCSEHERRAFTGRAAREGHSFALTWFR